MNNQHNNTMNAIYFKNYINSSYSNKIDVKNILIFILSNVVMITVIMTIFSLSTDDVNLSIKPEAFDDSQNSITNPYNTVKETSTTTTLDYTSVINTQSMQVTEDYADVDSKTTTSPTSNEMYGIVNTEKDPLNLRSHPSIESDVIAKIPKGTAITILSEEDEWLKVQYIGLEGYVSKNFILLSDVDVNIHDSNEANTSDKKIGIVITEKDPLNVRQYPLVDSKKLGTIPKGGQVVIVSEDEDWFEIEYGSGTGYVSKKYISIQN